MQPHAIHQLQGLYARFFRTENQNVSKFGRSRNITASKEASRLAAEFLLPVLDHGEGSRADRTSRAHDEPLAISGNVELEIAGCSVLCDAGNAVQRLRFAQLESPSDRYGLEPIVHTHVEKLTSVWTPPR